MSECPGKEDNLEICPCPKESCERRGNCCQCVAFHRKKGDLPNCLRK